MTMKALKMYLVALLVVFMTASLMYAVAKIGARRDARERNLRIQELTIHVEELESALSACESVYEGTENCEGAMREVLVWKELAERCVDDKVKVKAR
jgi:hypothetical protein